MCPDEYKPQLVSSYIQLLYSRGVLFVAGDVVKGQAEADEETSNKDRIKMAVGKDLKVLLFLSQHLHVLTASLVSSEDTLVSAASKLYSYTGSNTTTSRMVLHGQRCLYGFMPRSQL